MKRSMMLLVATLSLLLGLAVPATAQQGPRPNCPSGGYPPCNNDTTEVRSFGQFRAGEQFNKEDCGFDRNATTQLTFNGAEAGTRASGDDGCVRMQVTIGQNRQVTFNGRTFTGRCGQNGIVVTGPSGGATRTITNRFDLNCAGGVADTSRSLPRTGGEVAGLVVAGTALGGIGAVLVVASRRRRRAIA